MIKCGNCASEYSPRKIDDLTMDNSCPVCGHGKKNIQELHGKMKDKKNILQG